MWQICRRSALLLLFIEHPHSSSCEDRVPNRDTGGPNRDSLEGTVHKAHQITPGSRWCEDGGGGTGSREGPQGDEEEAKQREKQRWPLTCKSSWAGFLREGTATSHLERGNFTYNHHLTDQRLQLGTHLCSLVYPRAPWCRPKEWPS